MNPGHFGEKHDKTNGKPYHAITNQHFALSANRTGTQRRTKVVHDTCIVCTAFDEKAHLGMKRCQAEKKSSP